MMNLGENELGFNPTTIGFPSIQGCHAVVYQTAAGIFGIHNYGGDDEKQYKERAEIFRDFVQGHTSGTSAGQRLYGVCFATTKRGYDGKLSKWRKELKTFADKLGFGGPIYGYDLAGRAFPADASVFVRYDKVGDACVIQVKQWNDGDATKLNNPHQPGDYMRFGRNTHTSPLTLRPAYTRTIVTVTDAGLATVYPVKL